MGGINHQKWVVYYCHTMLYPHSLRWNHLKPIQFAGESLPFIHFWMGLFIEWSFIHFWARSAIFGVYIHTYIYIYIHEYKYITHIYPMKSMHFWGENLSTFEAPLLLRERWGLNFAHALGMCQTWVWIRWLMMVDTCEYNHDDDGDDDDDDDCCSSWQ